MCKAAHRCVGEFWLNFPPTFLTWKGFSPAWVLWCVWRFVFWLKLLPHHEHLYGFSLWCGARCLLRSELHRNLFPHCWHRRGFSSVWILWCSTRSELTLKLFPHSCIEKVSLLHIFLVKIHESQQLLCPCWKFLSFLHWTVLLAFPCSVCLTRILSDCCFLGNCHSGLFFFFNFFSHCTGVCVSERGAGWWLSVSTFCFSPGGINTGISREKGSHRSRNQNSIIFNA